MVDEVRWEEQPRPELWLAQALAKGDRDELAVQAATELGVAGVIPWAADRSISRWEGAKVAKGRDRWATIVREASKQAIRPRVPGGRRARVHEAARRPPGPSRRAGARRPRRAHRPPARRRRPRHPASSDPRAASRPMNSPCSRAPARASCTSAARCCAPRPRDRRRSPCSPPGSVAGHDRVRAGRPAAARNADPGAHPRARRPRPVERGLAQRARRTHLPRRRGLPEVEPGGRTHPRTRQARLGRDVASGTGDRGLRRRRRTRTVVDHEGSPRHQRGRRTLAARTAPRGLGDRRGSAGPPRPVAGRRVPVPLVPDPASRAAGRRSSGRLPRRPVRAEHDPGRRRPLGRSRRPRPARASAIAGSTSPSAAPTSTPTTVRATRTPISRRTASTRDEERISFYRQLWDAAP